jgi:quercetin dioxygenase-like cupin family protein
MSMREFWLKPSDAAAFLPDRYSKISLAAGTQLFLGLNCFEPGQSQAVHTHDAADKFYLVLSGNARMIVGDATRDSGPGELVWAPAGMPHGVERAHERTVMLVGIAPPPKA